MTESGAEYLRSEAWGLLAPGFATRTDVIEAMRELAEHDEEVGLRADEAQNLVDELWDARLAYLATPARRTPTDDARVEAGFDDLSRQGLIAVMNCGWDQDEASTECREAAEAAGAGGYVFFHGQDATRLAEPDGVLYLGFDAVAPARRRLLSRRRGFSSRDEYDAAAVAVGTTVADAMRAQDLNVEWNGTPTSRITVTGLDWRRPLPPG